MMNLLTNTVFSKHCTYFFSSCCLCFGIDLSGLISRDEGVKRGEEWQERKRQGEGEKEGLREEMRPKDKGIILAKVGIINERLVHCKLINLTMKCFRD